jgi:hypothetical protein
MPIHMESLFTVGASLGANTQVVAMLGRSRRPYED